MRICVIDDDEIILNVITAVLQNVSACQVEGFAVPAMALSRSEEITFDLVLMDYRMGEMDGIECLRRFRANFAYKYVPIVMLTADQNRDLRLRAVKFGATDFLNKPFDPEELQLRVGNLMSLREAQLSLEDRARHLDHEIKKATQTLVKREEELIWRLARAIEVRDGNTGEHISRVAKVSEILARSFGMDAEFCRTLYLAAPLHDTGKLGIPDAILNKPDALTDEERAIIEKHTEIGGHILEDGDSDLIRMAEEIALTHHEKWDGTGYSRGLSGMDIPLSGRIVAVADVLDALCMQRTYKQAWTFRDACGEIYKQSGKHFDPDLIFAFEAGIEEIEQVYCGNNNSKLTA